MGVATRNAVGVDDMMWSSDHLHQGNDWPRSRKAIEKTMGHIAEGERRRITGDNAARIFGRA